MALIPSTRYPGKTAGVSPEYPLGEARNVATPGDSTGTPLEADILNDIFGFQQALLATAGVTASGSPDTALVSQYVQAVVAIVDASVPSPVPVTVKNFSNVASMVANTDLELGDVVILSAYYNSDTFEVAAPMMQGVILSAMGFDGGRTIPLTGTPGLYFWQDIQLDKVSISQFGAAPSQSAAVNDAAISAAISFAGGVYALGVGGPIPVFVPPGTHDISTTIMLGTGVKLYGVRGSSRLAPSAVSTPSTMVHILNAEGAEVRDLVVDTQFLALFNQTQIAILIEGSRNTLIRGVSTTSLGTTQPTHGGVGFRVDMALDADAHGVKIVECSSEGHTIGVHLKGPALGNIVRGCKLSNFSGIFTERDNYIAFPAEVQGFNISENVLTAYASGAGVGIEFDTIQAYAQMSVTSGYVSGNHISDFGRGVDIGFVCLDITLLGNTYTDIALEDVRDAGGFGYSGLDAVARQVTLGQHHLQLSSQGLLVQSKAGAAPPAYGGLTENFFVASPGPTTLTPASRRVILTTVGSGNRTLVIDTVGAVDGQELTLLWHVGSGDITIDPSTIRNTSGLDDVLMTRGTLDTYTVELVYSTSIGLWLATVVAAPPLVTVESLVISGVTMVLPIASRRLEVTTVPGTTSASLSVVGAIDGQRITIVSSDTADNFIMATDATQRVVGGVQSIRDSALSTMLVEFEYFASMGMWIQISQYSNG